MLKKTSLSSATTWIAFLVWKTLKFGFLYFYKSCIELNFLSKNFNPESIGILSRNLWPKYETGAENNTKTALSSIFSQNFIMGINIKSVQSYLIDLSFPFASEERFLKNKLDRETDTSCEKIQKCSKNVIIFSSNLKRIFGWENIEIWFSLFLEKL